MLPGELEVCLSVILHILHIFGGIMYAVQDQVYSDAPFYGAIPDPYVPVRVTGGAVIAHLYSYAPPS